jgi:hypothetical protein
MQCALHLLCVVDGLYSTYCVQLICGVYRQYYMYCAQIFCVVYMLYYLYCVQMFYFQYTVVLNVLCAGILRDVRTILIYSTVCKCSVWFTGSTKCRYSV